MGVSDRDQVGGATAGPGPPLISVAAVPDRSLLRGVIAVVTGLSLIACRCPVSGARGTGGDETRPRVFAVSSADFDVVSEDAVAARYSLTASREVMDTVRRYFKLPGGPAKPILVRLVPSLKWSGEGSFHTIVETAGEVSVSIHWHRGLEREAFVRALVRASLLRWIIWTFGSRGELALPLWIELAMTEETIARNNPAYREYLRTAALDSLPFSLSGIIGVQSDGHSSPAASVAAYWLFRFILSKCESREHFRTVLGRLIMGENAQISREILRRTLGDRLPDGEDLDLWWLVGSYYITDTRGASVYSMARSVRLINDLSDFVLEVENGSARIDIQDLYSRREDGTVQAVIRRRLRAVQAEIALINPVYTNALISLGQSLEAVEKGDESSFQDLLRQFRKDTESAHHLSI